MGAQAPPPHPMQTWWQVGETIPSSTDGAPTPLPSANASHRHRKGNKTEKNCPTNGRSSQGSNGRNRVSCLVGDKERLVSVPVLRSGHKACPQAAFKAPEGRGTGEAGGACAPCNPSIPRNPGHPESPRPDLGPPGKCPMIPLAVPSAISPAKQDSSKVHFYATMSNLTGTRGQRLILSHPGS